MSAWMVSKHHIDALVTAGLSKRSPKYPGDGDTTLTWRSQVTLDAAEAEPVGESQFAVLEAGRWELSYATADEVGAMLWTENLRSVAYRYPEDRSGDRPGPIDLTDEDVLSYHFTKVPGEVSPGVVFKLLDCYEYQSCEHPEWRNSAAKAFCDALRDRMCRRVVGYEEAPWGADDANVFGVAVAS